MGVKLTFCAQSADWIKKKTCEYQLKGPLSITDLIRAHSELLPILKRKNFVRVAVNHEFVDYEKEVRNGDEIAFFPPFSGG